MRRRDALAGLAAFAGAPPAPAQPAKASGEALEAWAAQAAVPFAAITADDPGVRSLADRLARAAVVALGEPGHGFAEPLALRDALIARWLGQGAVTAIALETGACEGRRLDAYVQGGPGDAATAAAEGFNWGFGVLPANVRLLERLRAHNATAGARPVRVFGIDVSGGDATGAMTGTDRPLRALAATLAQGPSASARRLGGRLAAAAGDFSHEAFVRLASPPRLALARDLAAAEALLRPRDGVGRIGDPWTAAWRDAVGARQLLGLFEAWPPARPGEPLSPDFYRVSNQRDAAMAETALWIARTQGAAGRTLVYAHDGHVMAAPTTGGPWAVYRGRQHPAGERLRAALGGRLVIAAGLEGAPGCALASAAQAGEPGAWLDFAAAPPSVAVALSRPAPVRVNGTIAAQARLGPGADVAVTFPRLSRVVP